jgi:peptidoglycan hydrolase-like protein with peptidoglycan-binding domain
MPTPARPQSTETAKPRQSASPRQAQPTSQPPLRGADLNVLSLQRLIGNRATQNLLQREGEDDTEAAPAASVEETPLLSPNQSVRAQSYYQQRQTEYTPDVITRIQTAVGVTPPTGVIDDATVQAVARFQSRDPLLKVDGMAGPRTLPAAFPSGLAEEDRLDSFVEGASDIESRWAEYPDADARVNALTSLVNERLVASGVPACLVVVNDLPNLLGQFDFTTWTLEIGRPAFANDTISNEEAADAADTVYHEARHAEQWFRMAQCLAGQGRNAAFIATHMSIPAAQASAAEADPLTRGSVEYLIADGWYQSVYGSGSAERERTLAELSDADTALDAAQAAVDANPTPANQAALTRATARRQAAFEAYQQLPEENDAWRTGGRVTSGMLAADAETESLGSASPF